MRKMKRDERAISGILLVVYLSIFFCLLVFLINWGVPEIKDFWRHQQYIFSLSWFVIFLGGGFLSLFLCESNFREIMCRWPVWFMLIGGFLFSYVVFQFAPKTMATFSALSAFVFGLSVFLLVINERFWESVPSEYEREL